MRLPYPTESLCRNMGRVWKRIATAVSRQFPVHQDYKRQWGLLQRLACAGKLPIRHEFSLVLTGRSSPLKRVPVGSQV